MRFGFDQWTEAYGFYGTIEYAAYYDDDMKPFPIPNVMTFDPKNRMFKVETSDRNLLSKVYEIAIGGTLSGTTSFSKFNLTFTRN